MSFLFGALSSSARALLSSRLGLVATLVAALVGVSAVGLLRAVAPNDLTYSICMQGIFPSRD
jgi:hypothetical protein